jgi:hypothetical protein
MVTESMLLGVLAGYERLRADPEEWASYQAEARLTGNAAGDGLGNAAEEYPEYNS